MIADDLRSALDQCATMANDAQGRQQHLKRPVRVFVILYITDLKEGARMRIERELKKVGGSVMVPIPAEILRELRWEPGLRVSVDSEGGAVRIEPVAERPPDDIAEFVSRFTKKYDQALRNLSER